MERDRHDLAPWVWRQVMEATAWHRTPRFRVRHRDRSDGRDFLPKAVRIGITAVLTPVRAAQANAIAERVMGTLRRECFDHIIVRDERHLRRVFRECVQFYNDNRPHRSSGLESPNGSRAVPAGAGPIIAEPVLGGVHHVYRRVA